MARASIPVDLFNPGQVFACLGFAEAAEVLLGDAEGAFDWGDPVGARFHLSAAGGESPFRRVLAFLGEAEVLTEAPVAGDLETTKWGVPTEARVDDVFPFPQPSSPATLPAVLRAPGFRLVVDYWGDATRRDNVKFWGGAAGFPGAGLLRDALALVRDRLPDAAEDPFAVSAVQTSSFRFDWRRDYIPIDTGFSLNAHANVRTLGFPLVEVMAAIGLTHARPARPDPRDKLVYRYGALGLAPGEADTLFRPILLRAALGAVALPLHVRRFRMQLGWPGQEGQARSITTVSEES